MEPREVAEIGPGFWKELWMRLRRNKVAFASLIYIFLAMLVAIFAQVVTPFSYEEQDIARQLLGPNSTNWMGTDSLGRDLYSRIVYGARVSMTIGISTAAVSLFVGTIYGAISGYISGKWDMVLMRIVDILYTFPSMILLILMGMVLGRGIFGMILALAIVGWVRVARLVRGLVLQVKEMTYVEGARAVGVGGPRIIRKHVLPNIMGPIIVMLTYQIPQAILAESFLSFIGLGLQPPHSSWGVLANEGWRALRAYPHLTIFPGAVIFVTMLAFNFIGDGLRDAIDPHLRTFRA